MKLIKDGFLVPANYDYFNNYLDNYYLIVINDILYIYNKDSQIIYSKETNKFIISCFNNKGTELVVIEQGLLSIISLEKLEIIYILENNEFKLRTKKELESVIYVNKYNEEYIVEEDEVIYKIEFTNDNTKLVILKNTAIILCNIIDKAIKISYEINYFVDFKLSFNNDKCIVLSDSMYIYNLLDLNKLNIIEKLNHLFSGNLIFTNDGNHMIGFNYPSISIIDLKNYEVIKEINYCKSLGSGGFNSPVFDISNDDKYLLISDANASDDNPHIVEIETNKLVKYFDISGLGHYISSSIDSVKFSYSNKYVLINYPNGGSFHFIFNVETQKEFNIGFDPIRSKILDKGRYILYKENEITKFGEIIYE